MILLGHMASCFKNGKLSGLFWFFFFKYLFLIPLLQVSCLNHLLSLAVLLYGTVPLGEGERLRACAGLECSVPFSGGRRQEPSLSAEPRLFVSLWKNTSGV